MGVLNRSASQLFSQVFAVSLTVWLDRRVHSAVKTRPNSNPNPQLYTHRIPTVNLLYTTSTPRHLDTLAPRNLDTAFPPSPPSPTPTPRFDGFTILRFYREGFPPSVGVTPSHPTLFPLVSTYFHLLQCLAHRTPFAIIVAPGGGEIEGLRRQGHFSTRQNRKG